jgi:3'-phosphoadenosine 5'-phosphosulfate sulfotransferase (PAPS reductase)/FAD synthetase
MSRIIAWFSHGAASAVAAKLAIEKYGDVVEVVYCDTSKNEHPDNLRFRAQVEAWIGKKITVIASKKYSSVEQVARIERYMAGPQGAKCTVVLKKIPRFEFQRADDLQIYGFTADEINKDRIPEFERANPELSLEWILRDAGYTKRKCFLALLRAGIDLPIMYSQGFRNNNCIGCYKATSPGYWNLVRQHYPKIFSVRAQMSRWLGVRLVQAKGKKRIFLDELDPSEKGRYKAENISCGPECAPPPESAPKRGGEA